MEEKLVQQEQEEIKPIIEIKNLHKAYGKKKVLKGLDLEVYPGELFGFLGKNGIGKSTTIDSIVGVKKFDKGTILLNGFDVVEQPLQAKRTFGYVASEPTAYETMTGYDFLEFIANIYQITEADFRTNYKYLSNRLGLTEQDLSKSISEYSHGMKQKVCLIASLMGNPKIWILDEPTVGLDIMAVEELKKMMQEYAAHGNAVLITSHNIDLVAKICDRVGLINDGHIAMIYDLKKNPNIRLQLAKKFLDLYKGDPKENK